MKNKYKFPFIIHLVYAVSLPLVVAVVVFSVVLFAGRNYVKLYDVHIEVNDCSHVASHHSTTASKEKERKKDKKMTTEKKREGERERDHDGSQEEARGKMHAKIG